MYNEIQDMIIYFLLAKKFYSVENFMLIAT
jgi:hypothetical protein